MTTLLGAPRVHRIVKVSPAGSTWQHQKVSVLSIPTRGLGGLCNIEVYGVNRNPNGVPCVDLGFERSSRRMLTCGAVQGEVVGEREGGEGEESAEEGRREGGNGTDGARDGGEGGKAARGRGERRGRGRLAEPVGVVIVDHGSRRKESNDLLHFFVEVYKAETGRTLVELAHMELAEPTIAEAFLRCVQRGAKSVIVSPYFLSPGRHWAKDIPALVAAAAQQCPGIEYLVAAPIGVHSLVARVLEDRIQYCVSRVMGEVEECSMCAGTELCQLKMSEDMEDLGTRDGVENSNFVVGK